MSNLKGLYLIGQLAGFRQFNGVSKKTNNPFTINYLGVHIEREDAYGTKTETVEIQIPKSALDAGILHKIESLKGKQVMAKVYGGAYVSNNRAGFQLNLSTEDDALQELNVNRANVKAA